MSCANRRDRCQTSRSAACPNDPVMRRYPHPICTTSPDTCDQSGELLRCILSMLCAQSETLEEIKSMLEDGNKL